MKKVAEKDPNRVIQRVDYLMTELSFLLDILDFQKLDPRYGMLVA